MASFYAAIGFILPFLLTIALPQSTGSPAATPSTTGSLSIEDACKQTAKLYDLCTATLSPDRSSLTADAVGLTRAAVLAVQKNASETATYLSNIDEDDNFNKTAQLQQCLEDCGERYEAAVEQLADAAIALDMGAYDESQVLVSAGQAEVRLCQKGCQDLPEHRSILMARNTEVDQLCNITLAIAKLIPR
ncbi:unnamed protein product [Triticum turgidum subsp. durum]|uniref:Pectin methyl esterase inhibitor n=1 Tax=Triticum turgidum subsp. durum TaxID=4567 RepID=I7HUL9_TRITD|nr:pectin methyl esterase inhibitor [Triticum turgidum subsp. durum]VAH53306.1 unnamed protein product [Triticum turgidum subsp. durum]